MKKPFFISIFVLTLALPGVAFSHCQVPCGIFDDAARIAELEENITTIGKAIKLINELSSKSDAQSVNQRTRWVMVKEQHAEKIIEMVSDYFLAQRVKQPADAKADQSSYLSSLASHHEVMVAAMKAKQGADQKLVERLSKAVAGIASLYK